MQAFLKSQRNWLVVEWLPVYAPDLNPVEQVLGESERGANLPISVPTPLEKRRRSSTRDSAASATTHTLAAAFLRHCGLKL
jgi:transposase